MPSHPFNQCSDLEEMMCKVKTTSSPGKKKKKRKRKFERSTKSQEGGWGGGNASLLAMNSEKSLLSRQHSFHLV